MCQSEHSLVEMTATVRLVREWKISALRRHRSHARIVSDAPVKSGTSRFLTTTHTVSGRRRFEDTDRHGAPAAKNHALLSALSL